jgi:aspartyl-tRNA(Asn)/glutamyl-tRNA(Gln) amidotransferase subunit A
MPPSSTSFVADPGSLTDLRLAMQEGRTDPRQLLEKCLARIDAVESQVQGWRIVDRDNARAQESRIHGDTSGSTSAPLRGIPVAIKDVIDVAGLPTRAGSRTRESVTASASDATIVAWLRAAGAIVVGKAHTTEFAYFDGPPPTRNPYDLARTPGGSSGGPAAVVAAGMVPLSIGTQTAGSVCRPAAYCGIAAFKPSTLSWPTFGVVPFAPSFDTVGVFAYRTADATTAARVLMPAFLRRRPVQPTNKDFSVAIVDDAILDVASAATRQIVRSVADRLTKSGVRMQSQKSPVSFSDMVVRHKTVAEYELARAHPALVAAPPDMVTPALLAAIERGNAIRDDNYREVLRELDASRRHFWTAFISCDAVLFPAAPDIAPRGMKTGDPRFIIPFTALGGPIVTIPVGFDQGLPLGMMLAGAPGTDAMLADIADRLAPSIEIER